MITIEDINNDYTRSIICQKLGKKKNEVKEKGHKFFLRNSSEIISSEEEYYLLDRKAQERYLLSHRIYHVHVMYERIKDNIKRKLYIASQNSLFSDKSKCYAIVSNYKNGTTMLHELTEGSFLDISSIGDDKENYIVDQLIKYNRFVGYLTSKKLEEAQKLVTSTITLASEDNQENITDLVGKLTRELMNKQ